MTGSHEVRGSIPLSSTKKQKKGLQDQQNDPAAPFLLLQSLAVGGLGLLPSRFPFLLTLPRLCALLHHYRQKKSGRANPIQIHLTP